MRKDSWEEEIVPRRRKTAGDSKVSIEELTKSTSQAYTYAEIPNAFTVSGTPMVVERANASIFPKRHKQVGEN